MGHDPIDIDVYFRELKHICKRSEVSNDGNTRQAGEACLWLVMICEHLRNRIERLELMLNQRGPGAIEC